MNLGHKPSLLFALSITFLAIQQIEAQGVIQLGDVINGLIFPDEEITGGFQSLFDRVSKFDASHEACGQRGICESFSSESVRRSDGSVEIVRGFGRRVLDGIGEFVFDAVRPYMYRFGLGRIARGEETFGNFLIDMIDSALIWLARSIAGNRISRQFEAIAPVRTALEVLPNFLPSGDAIGHIGNLLDLAVDLTGVMDRDRGTYTIMRSGVLGYFQGDNGICKALDADDPKCNTFWDVLNPLNDHKIGKTVNPGNQAGPLWDRNYNRAAMHPSQQFEFSDITKPKILLCKIDNYLDAMDGHIDIVSGDVDEPSYYYDEIDIGDYPDILDHEILEVKRRDDYDIGNINLADEETKNLQEYSKKTRKITKVDKFKQRCKQERRKTFIKYMKDKRLLQGEDVVIAAAPVPLNDTVLDVRDKNATDTAVIVDATNSTNSEEDDINEDDISSDEGISRLDSIDLDSVAKVSQRSLLMDRVEMGEDVSEFDFIKDLLNNMELEKEGELVKVEKTRLRQSGTSFAILLSSPEYRDHILFKSKTKEGRSILKTIRLRKPKLRDIKQLTAFFRR